MFKFPQGNGVAVAISDLSNINESVTSTVLSSNGVFISNGTARVNEVYTNIVNYISFSNVSGTIYVEESEDGTTWTVSNTTIASANTTIETGFINLTKRYYRVRYVNGSSAQTLFLLQKVAGSTSSLTVSNNTLKGAVLDVTTAGTRIQLPNYPCHEVTVIAKDTNSGNIFAGGSDVSSSIYGVKLKADSGYTFTVSNTNLIWLDASVSGEGVSYVAI